MKSQTLLLLLLSSLLLTFSCKKAADQTGNENPAPFTPQQMVANQMNLIRPEPCTSLKENEFCIRGPWFMQLGENLVWDTLVVPGAVIKDTVYEEITNIDTFAWNVKIVRFTDGQVILESDFNTFELLGRVRIEKPGIKSQQGIGVGSTVKELLQTYDSFQLAPYPEMELIEINPSGSNNIFFHIPDPGNELQNAKGGALSPADLDPTAKISRIVIWDNTIGNPES